MHISEMNGDTRRTILVTGFGPFGLYERNPSWEAVTELQNLWEKYEEFPNFQLVIEQIPVSYEYVSIRIPQLWQQHNPAIVLHVGLSAKAEYLTIECYAHSIGYKRMDIDAKCPDETCVERCVLTTQINVEELCRDVNKNFEKHKCKACLSDNAGRYLCEYIYYKSLSISRTKTLFVHVPDVFCSLNTAEGLYNILCYLIRNSKSH